MFLQCQIPKGITTNIYKKLKSTMNELSPNQMVDFISDYLHEFRNKRLKTIQNN